MYIRRHTCVPYINILYILTMVMGHKPWYPRYPIREDLMDLMDVYSPKYGIWYQ